MTVFLNFRTHNVNGSVVAPRGALELADAEAPLQYRPVAFAELSQRAAGKDVLFATHGFNVSQEHGARSLARLEQVIAPTGGELFVGLLWPGDWWLPAVNYPFAGAPAMATGRELVQICTQWLADAASLSFVSHSLGARVILEATRSLSRSVRNLCITAGAVNRDCLRAEYAQAQQQAASVCVLASDRDRVLKLAFPIGDVFADLLHDDHAQFTAALGYRGPARPIPANTRPSQIDPADDYDHGDYLPSGDVAPDTNPQAKWRAAASFIARAFRRQEQPWPR